jgi:methenyltetrahydromethanopterin cyclohydrolase
MNEGGKQLNARALRIVESMITRAGDLRIRVESLEGGGRAVDCGVMAPGGLAAGLDLARVCLGGLADVRLTMGMILDRACPMVHVVTDHPVAACLASQYAGWQLAEGKFFAMGSGPIRAAAGREELFSQIGHKEHPGHVVGVLETRQSPPPEIVRIVAEACGVPAHDVTLLFAPTASLACGVQVVARSVETALHKLHELGFDLARVISGQGSAPLPPVAKNDLAAIGRTNDAVLYGASVILNVTGADDSLTTLGPRVPSSSSKDYGEPFAGVFKRYNHDFYAVDPMLFSPAQVVFHNLTTGRAHVFGHVASDILARSFFE